MNTNTISASRIDNGSLLVFTACSAEYGPSRKIFVRTDDLLAWLNDENNPFDFSVCGLSDFLRICRGVDGLFARVTTTIWKDDDTFTGWHVYAALPQSFFDELFEEGAVSIVAVDPFKQPEPEAVQLVS